MKKVDTGTIRFNTQISDAYHLMGLTVPAAFQESLPGQFVMLRIPGRDVPLLGRPFSIYSRYSDNGDTVIEILYRVAGKGTRLFSRMTAGEDVHVLGPLGQPFAIVPGLRQVILVAGGIGVAPLSFLAEHYGTAGTGSDRDITCYFGAQSGDGLIGLDRMQRICSDVRTSTDDGSAGYHGLVTDLFDREVASCTGDTMVYACGPHQMMRSLAGIMERHPCRCQVSVEERMACGFGTCLGCTVVTRTPSGETQFARACREGPVFDIGDIVWE